MFREMALRMHRKIKRLEEVRLSRKLNAYFTSLLSGSVCCFVGQEINDKRLRWSCVDDVLFIASQPGLHEFS